MRAMTWLLGAVLFATGCGLVTGPASTGNTNATTANAPCRAEPLAAVYHPQRLKMINPCLTVTGVVVWLRHEEDGDYHLRLRLDAGADKLLNEANRKEQYGALVLEIIPADQDELSIPRVGDHIRATGFYNQDLDHGWRELHPVWAITWLDSGQTQVASPPTAEEKAHPKGGS